MKKYNIEKMNDCEIYNLLKTNKKARQRAIKKYTKKYNKKYDFLDIYDFIIYNQITNKLKVI